MDNYQCVNKTEYLHMHRSISLAFNDFLSSDHPNEINDGDGHGTKPKETLSEAEIRKAGEADWISDAKGSEVLAQVLRPSFAIFLLAPL